MDYIKQCRELYDDKFKRIFGEPAGNTPNDITNFEEYNAFKLPESYKQFLLWMGNDLKGVFQGSEWFLKNVEENTKYLDDFLYENEISLEHCGKPICFFSHQGYMSAWFYLPADQPDPKCYFFSEVNKEKTVIVYESFSSFLLHELNGVVL